MTTSIGPTGAPPRQTSPLDGRLVAMSRLLSDGVCNAYLLDVWTQSAVRRGGVATVMVRHLMNLVPGQHIGLQTDTEARGVGGAAE